MRITQNMLSHQFLRNLNLSLTNMQKLQQQLSSGKTVSKPSDDPVVAVRSIQLNSQIKTFDQYTRNLGTAVKWMDTTDTVLQEAQNIFKTIREKLTQGANGTLDDQSREAIAHELQQLKEQLGSLANTSIAGRSIFAGTKTDQLPYQNGNFVDANVNEDKISVELGKGVFIDINTDGNNLFNKKDGDGNNIFEFLDSAINELEGMTPQNVKDYLDKLEFFEGNFLTVHSALGASKNRIELIKNRMEDLKLTTTEQLSLEEDADLAQVIANINMQENVHRLALGTGARVMQPTLMDFLR